MFLFLGMLFLPLMAFAGQYSVNDGGTTVAYSGLVPCGKPVNVGGNCCILQCTLCHFFVMFDNILDFVMFNLIPIIAVLMMVLGGVTFLLAGTNPGNVAKGKSIITSTAIGLVIIFSAWILVNTFFMAIGVAKWTKLSEGWFQIKCGITTEACGSGGLPTCKKVSEEGKTPCSKVHSNGDPVTAEECEL